MKEVKGKGKREKGKGRTSRRCENTLIQCSLHCNAAIRRAVFPFSLFPFSFSLLSGCARPPKPGLSDVPPGVRKLLGVYVDVNPRWSHDGKRIAFLRNTTDRKMQLQVTDGSLKQVQALFAPELLCPDRPYSPQLQRYSSPDTLAWSPNDRLIAFERTDWFLFEDGERLPGTGLWSFDRQTRAVQPLALHAPTYKNLFYFYHTPQWSPDGRYFAFVGEGINGQRTVFTRSLALQNPKAVTPRFDTYADSDWPVWQEGGEEGEKGRGGEEETAGQGKGKREKGKEETQSVIGNRQSAIASSLFFRQGIVHALAVPPTETLRCLSPGSAQGGSAREMWRTRAGELRGRLPNWDKERAIAPRMGHLAWSPDGRRLAFTLTPDANDYAAYAVWIINADGTGAHRVSLQDGRGYVAPVWIGNNRLGALSPRANRFEIVTLDLRGGAKRVLGVIATSDCDWSPDRKRIVYATPPDRQSRADNATTLQMLKTGL